MDRLYIRSSLISFIDSLLKNCSIRWNGCSIANHIRCCLIYRVCTCFFNFLCLHCWYFYYLDCCIPIFNILTYIICLLCSHINVQVMELYSIVIQVRGWSSYWTRFNSQFSILGNICTMAGIWQLFSVHLMCLSFWFAFCGLSVLIVPYSSVFSLFYFFSYIDPFGWIKYSLNSHAARLYSFPSMF